MKRNFGSPGRLDLSAIEPSPAHAYVDHKARVVTGFVAVGVILLGGAAVAAFLFELGAHLAMGVIASGRGS